MVALGVIVTVAGVGLRLDPMLVLIGVMLAISGAVKLVMVRLWRELPPGDRSPRPLLRRRQASSQGLSNVIDERH